MLEPFLLGPQGQFQADKIIENDHSILIYKSPLRPVSQTINPALPSP